MLQEPLRRPPIIWIKTIVTCKKAFLGFPAVIESTRRRMTQVALPFQ